MAYEGFVFPSGVDSASLPSCMFTEASPKISAALRQYYKDGRFSDIVVVTEDRTRLKCHRVVLACNSTKLDEALAEEDFPHGSELVLKGVESAALEAIIAYFYAGSIHITVPLSLPILAGAVKLDVSGLQSAVHSFVAQILAREPGLLVAFMEQSTSLNLDTMTESLLTYSAARWE